MDKLWPTLLILVVLALIFVGMWWGWRRRARRDAALVVPNTLDAPGEQLLTVQALHVATTYHDKPLDRVVVAGLAFRANAGVTVWAGGVTIAAPGEPNVAIAAPAIVGVGAATWTIDRTVERDGLILLAWHTAPTAADDAVLDTYLRVTDLDDRHRLEAAIRNTIHHTTGSET
ncbi:hypothetical protein GCM10027568_08070 [Humibacter soli]